MENIFPYSLIGSLNIFQMTILPKAIYRGTAIPIKSRNLFFVGETHPENLIRYIKESQIAKTSWEKNKVGGLTLPDF